MTAACLHAAEYEVGEHVMLDNEYSFRVERNDGHEIAVSLFYSGADPESLLERYSYANGVVLPGGVQSVELDQSNDAPEFLIKINDRTSTYGAAMGIILWKRGHGWRLVKIPHEKFAIAVEGNRKHIEINGRKYTLADGFFVPEADQ